MKKNILAKLSPFHFLMLLIAGIINAIGVTLFFYDVKMFVLGMCVNFIVVLVVSV